MSSQPKPSDKNTELKKSQSREVKISFLRASPPPPSSPPRPKRMIKAQSTTPTATSTLVGLRKGQNPSIFPKNASASPSYRQTPGGSRTHARSKTYDAHNAKESQMYAAKRHGGPRISKNDNSTRTVKGSHANDTQKNGGNVTRSVDFNAMSSTSNQYLNTSNKASQPTTDKLSHQLHHDSEGRRFRPAKTSSHPTHHTKPTAAERRHQTNQLKSKSLSHMNEYEAAGSNDEEQVTFSWFSWDDGDTEAKARK